MKESNFQSWAVNRLRKEELFVLVNKQKYERGWPDLIVFVGHKPVGLSVFIELKTGTKTTMIQDYILLRLSSLGFLTYVAKTREDIEQIIEEINSICKTK